MYFVTMKRPGYVMFGMTPSERFAVGLTEQQVVHLLERSGEQERSGRMEWKVLREWPAATYSHTAFMAGLRGRDEPSSAADLIGLLPPELRG